MMMVIKKTKPKTKTKTWRDRTITAKDFAELCCDSLDSDLEMEMELVNLVAEAIADFFGFDGRDREEFLAVVNVNHAKPDDDDDH
jgi:hypothetical protein